MKKAVVFAIATLASATALAAGKVIVRSDYVNTMDYKDKAGTEVKGTSLLMPIVSRVEFDSKINDATVVGHLNLRSFIADTPDSGTTYNKVMTVDKFVDRLYIVKPLGDFSTSVGKLYMNVGGWERAALVHGDTYFTSLANNGAGGKETAAALNPGKAGTVDMPENGSGVGIAYTMGDHRVEAQVGNQTNTDKSAALNRRHTMGVQYDGSFMDKSLMVTAAYTAAAVDTTTAAVNDTFLNAGVRYTGVENLNLSVEHISNTSKATTSGAKADSTVSNVVEARYAMGVFTPIFKFESSENKVAEAKTFARTGMALALEIAPNEDAFRYHAAYVSLKDKYESAGAKDVTYNQIYAGIKYTGALW